MPQQDHDEATPSHIRVAIHPRLIQQIEEQDCFWLDRQAAVNTFIKLGLDRGITLIKPSAPEGRGPQESESFISKKRNIDVEKKPQKRLEYSEEFEQWWSAYQSLPRDKKVGAQSKPKAYDEWKRAQQQEPAKRLLIAAERFVQDCLRRKDDYRAPDAFRWLRDGRYAVLLESHAPAQRERVKEQASTPEEDAVYLRKWHARVAANAQQED